MPVTDAVNDTQTPIGWIQANSKRLEKSHAAMPLQGSIGHIYINSPASLQLLTKTNQK
jgi:hypothetical protein